MPTSRSVVRSPGWNLTLATLAFMACFTAWGLIAPLAKRFQETLGLSSTATLFLTAVPVVLGSLLRIPVGMLTDRLGGRRVFSSLLAFSVLPAVLFGYACHNTTLGGTKVSGDYAGFAQEALEKASPGATALFLMLCGADQNPNPRGTPALARQHGEALAADTVGGEFTEPGRPYVHAREIAHGIVVLGVAQPALVGGAVQTLLHIQAVVRSQIILNRPLHLNRQDAHHRQAQHGVGCDGGIERMPLAGRHHAEQEEHRQVQHRPNHDTAIGHFPSQRVLMTGDAL